MPLVTVTSATVRVFFKRSEFTVLHIPGRVQLDTEVGKYAA